MKRRHGRSPVLRALGGALAVGACGQAEDPTNVTVTIDATVSHQTLVGFGAATAYLANLLSGRSDDIFQVLFVDSGLDILRWETGIRTRARPIRRRTPLLRQRLRPDRPEGRRRAGRNASQDPDVGVDAARVPQEQRRDQATPRRGGPDVSGGDAEQSGGSYAYAEYADWWVRALRAYAAQGVVPDYVSIQNEPDFSPATGRPACSAPAKGASMEGITVAGYGQALDAVYHAIQSSERARRCCSGPRPPASSTASCRDTRTDLAQLGGIAHHLYGTTEDNPKPRLVQRFDARRARPPPPWGCRPS